MRTFTKISGITYKGDDNASWQLTCNVSGCQYCQQGISKKYPEQGVCLKQQIILKDWQPCPTEPLIGVMATKFPFLSYSIYKCSLQNGG